MKCGTKTKAKANRPVILEANTCNPKANQEEKQFRKQHRNQKHNKKQGAAKTKTVFGAGAGII